MRKIDQQARAYFYSDTAGCLSQNTRIEVETLKNGDGETRLILWNTIIARKSHATGKIYIKTGGYSTTTTKARLNALDGVSISQKNWAWFLNGKEWDGSEVCLQEW